MARLDDFRSLEFFLNGKRTHSKCNRDKGHKKELELTISAIRDGRPSPIPFEELAEVTKASHAVLDSLNYGLPVKLQSHQAPLVMTNDLANQPLGVRKP